MRKSTTTLAGFTGLLLPLMAGVMTGAVAPASAVGESCDGRPATIVVAVNPSSYATDPVVGTPGDDVIVGTSRPDTIDGSGGNDVICGLEGGDRLTGGPGDDRLFGGLDEIYVPDDSYAGDLLIPGPGDDHVDLGADLDSLDLCVCDSPRTLDRVSYADAAIGVSVNLATGIGVGEGRDTIVGGGAFGVVGSRFADHLDGSKDPNLIESGGGADSVTGGDGKDWIWLDDDATPVAADTADAGPGRDTIEFSGGDRIVGGTGNDFVQGGSETHGSVQGNLGRDTIWVTGPISIRGGSGNDEMRASLLPDEKYVLHGDSGRNRLVLTVEASVPQGRLTLNLPRQRVTIAHQNGHVRLANINNVYAQSPGRRMRWTFIGSNRADTFATNRVSSVRAFGRGGNDDLSGGYRNDLLDGGPGRDSLFGDSGTDRCLRGEKLRECEVRR